MKRVSSRVLRGCIAMYSEGTVVYWVGARGDTGNVGYTG